MIIFVSLWTRHTHRKSHLTPQSVCNQNARNEIPPRIGNSAAIYILFFSVFCCRQRSILGRNRIPYMRFSDGHCEIFCVRHSDTYRFTAHNVKCSLENVIAVPRLHCAPNRPTKDGLQSIHSLEYNGHYAVVVADAVHVHCIVVVWTLSTQL